MSIAPMTIFFFLFLFVFVASLNSPPGSLHLRPCFRLQTHQHLRLLAHKPFTRDTLPHGDGVVKQALLDFVSRVPGGISFASLGFISYYFCFSLATYFRFSGAEVDCHTVKDSPKRCISNSRKCLQSRRLALLVSWSGVTVASGSLAAEHTV
eukprot:EG_transcript_40306